MHQVYSNCLQEGIASAEESSQGQAKHSTPTAPLQQETSGRDTDTLPVCPFKFQNMVCLTCSAVSFVLCPFKLQITSFLNCFAVSFVICYVMLCFAMPQLSCGHDTVDTHAPLYCCFTTTNPSEEVA